MIPRLPRAPADEVVAIEGALFNRLMDMLESFANLTVSPPLFINEGPHGKNISLASFLTTCLVKPTTVFSGRAAVYTGRIWITNIIVPTMSGAGALAATDFGADPGSDNCYCFNRQETSTGHALTVPFTLPCPGVIFGSYQGLPLVAIDQC